MLTPSRLAAATVVLLATLTSGRADLAGFKTTPTQSLVTDSSHPDDLPVVTPKAVTLTKADLSSGGSAVTFNEVQQVSGAWIARFTYAAKPGSDGLFADGFAFVLHNSSTLLGELGGGVGYQTGVTPSVAVVVRSYTFGNQGFALGVDGTIGANVALPEIFTTSERPIEIEIAHHPGIKRLEVTAVQDGRIARTAFAVDLVAELGLTAKVGFTGATGGSTQTTKISAFSFSEDPGPRPGVVHAGLLGTFPTTVATATSGSAQFVLTGTAVTGTLNWAGQRYAIGGPLDPTGKLARTLKKKGEPGETLSIQVQARGLGTEIGFSLTDSASGHSSTTLLKAARPRSAGRYTATLDLEPPPTAAPVEVPAARSLLTGPGFAVLKMNPDGTGKITGRLIDDVPFSATIAADFDEIAPIYASTHGGGGMLITNLATPGLLNPSQTAAVTLAAIVRPPNFGTLYPAGFTRNLGLKSIVYRPPASDSAPLTTNPPSLDGANADFAVQGGGLAPTFTAPCLLNEKPKLLFFGANAENAKAKRATGTFRGSFTHASGPKPFKFRGVFDQEDNAAYGIFTGTTETGKVTLTPR